MSSTTLSLIGVLALAVVHLLSGYLNRKAQVPPAWLTAASGMSTAYVFVHLLPELGQEQTDWLKALPNRPLPWLESQVYIATFFGVILWLGLDRVVQTDKPRFKVRLTSFAINNALIGCFALRVDGPVPLFLAVIAFGAHFLLHDRSLYMEFGRRYEQTGRWLLVAALITGWILGQLWPPPVIAVAVVLGIISGGIITHVIKEELPGRHEGRFSPWLAGALGYTFLLLLIDYTEFQ